jgi:DNA transformation protein and related proteins
VTPVSRKPSSLPNLGPVVDEWLREIGIETAGQLREIGSMEAWRRMRFVLGGRVGIVALYALDGALSGHDWRRLPPGRKAELNRIAKVNGSSDQT